MSRGSPRGGPSELSSGQAFPRAYQPRQPPPGEHQAPPRLRGLDSSTGPQEAPGFQASWRPDLRMPCFIIGRISRHPLTPPPRRDRIKNGICRLRGASWQTASRPVSLRPEQAASFRHWKEVSCRPDWQWHFGFGKRCHVDRSRQCHFDTGQKCHVDRGRTVFSSCGVEKPPHFRMPAGTA